VNRRIIVAIDGPAGSGKSTASKIIAKKLKLLYVDTGAMYRALTLKAIKMGVDLNDEEKLTKLSKGADIRLIEHGDSLKVILDGQDVSGEIRTPELTSKVKYIARVPGVRENMVNLQRAAADKGRGAVLEGRDIGTVVFPNASFKFYLDAGTKERARRRCKELIEKGQDVELTEIEKDVINRDESDKNRSVGALKKAEDAVYIDTSGLTVEQVTDNILGYIK
jgi:cytidylate kinase